MAGDGNKQSDQKINPNSEINEVDREMKRRELDIRKLFDDVKLKNKTDRYIRRMEAAIAVLYVPWEEKEKMWADIRNGLIEDKRAGRLTTEKLNDAMAVVNSEILGWMGSFVELTKHYVGALVKACENGRLDSRALLKMVKSEHVNIVKFVALTMEKDARFDKLKKTVKWATGMQEKSTESGTRSVDAGKPAAFEELTHQFDENRKQERYVRYAWFALGAVNDATRVEFGQQYLASKSPQEAMEFLEDGNKRGVFSPGEMEQILANTNKMEAVKGQFEGKRKQYETLWEVQNLFRQDVAILDHKTYQGGMQENGHTQFENMFTGKNALIEGGFIIAVGTLFGNTMVEFFKGGSLNFNMEAFKNVVGKTYSRVAGAFIVGRHLLKTDKHIPVLDNMAKSAVDKEDETKRTLGRKLKDANALSWGSFFEKEDFEGVYAISEWIKGFIDQDGKLAQDRLKLDLFKAHLKEKSPTLLAELEKTNGNQNDFKDICNAIFEFKIGGEKPRVISMFKEEIKNAQNA